MSKQYRYFITNEALQLGTYPYLEGLKVTDQIQPTVQPSGIKTYGHIDYPAPLSLAEAKQHYLLSAQPEQDFLQDKGDCFAVYQLRNSAENAKKRFMNTAWLKKQGIAPEKADYQLTYAAPLTQKLPIEQQLEQLFVWLNTRPPKDYAGRSLSVSDIVAVKRDGAIRSYYVDSIGFAEVPTFLSENALKNAEMQLEDDYSMIDGIINNGPKEQKTERISVRKLLEEYKNGLRNEAQACPLPPKKDQTR